MPFGEIVCGSPGSGKSTYCFGKYQLFIALNRPISVVNLDPANDALPYPCAIDISSLITLGDVMDKHGLGPNGELLHGISRSQLWLVGRTVKRTGRRCLCLVWSAWPSRAEYEPWKCQTDCRETDKKSISGVFKYPLSLTFQSRIYAWVFQ